MDNFRRRQFGFHPNEINGTEFRKLNELYGKKITKLYIPLIPQNINNLTYSNSAFGLQNYTGRAGSGNRKTVGITAYSKYGNEISLISNSNYYLYYHNIPVSSSINSLMFGYFPGGSEGIVRFQIIAGSNPVSFCGAIPSGSSIFNSDSVLNKDELLQLIELSLGLNYIPYMCIPFTALKYRTTDVAYVMFDQYSIDETILLSPLAEEVPFYYEEYNN